MKINFLVYFIFLNSLLFAQSKEFQNLEKNRHDFTFSSYTTDNGLSNNKINCFFQDSRGFMWIGTAIGLNRFDGLSFKTYHFVSADSNTLSDNRIHSIVEDSTGNLWILTGNQISLYNREKDIFSRKIFNVKNAFFDDFAFRAGIIDSEGYFWTSTWEAVYRFKLYANSQLNNKVIDVEKYLLFEDDANRKYSVTSFVEDENNRLWMANASNKLFYFDKIKNKIVPFPVNHPDTAKFVDREKKMMIDSEGDFIITIEKCGILIWDRDKNTFDLKVPDGTRYGPNNNYLFDFAEDNNGFIWFGDRDKGGINILDKKSGQFTYLLSNESDPFSLNSNKISCIYKDKAGSIWVGSIKGFNIFNYSRQKFSRYYNNPYNPNSLNFNNVLSFAESKSGDIFIGTDGGGLSIFDPKTGKFRSYINNPYEPNSLSSNAVVSIFEDHEGVVWLGTFNGGLVRKENDNFYSYVPDPSNSYSISSAHVWNILEDSKNNLWIGTLNQGIELFDRETGRFYHYKENIEDATSLINDAIIQLFEDSRQNLYITTYSGVSVIDLTQYDFSKIPPDIKFKNLVHSETNSLSNNLVNCVAEDLNGNILFGTMSTGFDRYDIKTKTFTNYSTKDGLPGNSVNSILVDDYNNLWIGTDRGLVKFNPDSNDIHVFNYHDGLQNMNLSGGAIKTKDGQMFFGGPNGFNSFFPEKISYNRNIPPVVITDFKVSNKKIKINERVNKRIILIKDIGETQKIRLSHKEDFFTFDFIALDYSAPEKNQYAYKMEGFDNDWIYCGTKREASYTNLNPGKYIFTVKACNSDGIWNEKGTTLKITITPPFWDTFLFKILVILLICFIVLVIYVYRVNYLEKQSKYLEKVVEERTLELENKRLKLEEQAQYLNETNTLLEERQQFIEEQSEELRAQADELNSKNKNLNKLNATKDKFFSIIAHDLKNPFNSILGFSELLSSKFNELDNAKRKQYSDIIFSSVSRIYRLLENLLQWARTQTGNIEFRPGEVDLHNLVEGNLLLLNNLLNEKGIVIENNSVSNAKICADRNMIDTVIRNLLTNAIKFTDKGKISIVMSLINGFWELKIEDSGMGISEERINKIFEIDQSKSTEGTRGETGTGLGLIICKEFIEKNNGKILVQSQLGHGSAFTIYLPSI